MAGYPRLRILQLSRIRLPIVLLQSCSSTLSIAVNSAAPIGFVVVAVVVVVVVSGT